MGPAPQAHVPDPAGPCGDLEGLGQSAPGSPVLQAVALVPVPQPGGGEVHRQDQCFTARGLGPLKHGPHHAPVPQHVELEPAGAPGGSAQFLWGTGAQGGKGKGNAHTTGRPQGLDLTPPRHITHHAHGSQDHGEGRGFAQQGRAGIHPGNIPQHPLPEQHLLEGRRIGRQGLLRVGATIDVVEEKARQASPRQLAVVRDRDGEGAGGVAHADPWGCCTEGSATRGSACH